MRDKTTIPFNSNDVTALPLSGPRSITPAPAGSGYLTLASGAAAVWNGSLIHIVAVRDLGRVQIIDPATQAQLDVPVESLRALPAPALALTFDRVDASSDEWATARELAADFEGSIQLAKLPRAILLALGRKYAMSPRTIQRKRAKYLIHRRAVSLLKAPGGRSTGLTALDPRSERVIQFVIARYVARREAVSGLEAAERVRALCRRLGWPVPSVRTVARRIAGAAGPTLDKAQLGAKAARQRWAPVPGQLAVTRALAVCQIDHTLVDVEVLSPERDQNLGRPWLTVAIDVATRCVLGIYLTMDHPSALSVAMCLEHAMLPKEAENRDHPGRWPMYGKVGRVHSDNGKDFRSHALEAGCAEHAIELDFRPPATPRFGGHIERIMGTLMRIVHGLPGTTFSNVQQRGDYPSERHASLTLAELREWLVARICHYYHARRHRGLGVAPLVAWERAWTQPSGELTLPPLVPAPDLFRLDFLPCERRMIRRDGITFRKSRYWHPAMWESVGRQQVVLVRFHPGDLSRVWFRAADGSMVEAHAVAGAAVGQGLSPHTPEETRRLDAAIDQGFKDSDQIEALARARRRKRTPAQSRPVAGRGGRKKRPAADPAPASEIPAVIPNRAGMRTEELF